MEEPVTHTFEKELDDGINMTQRFEFETDSLKSFLEMLITITNICFRKENSMYVQRHIRGDKPYMFRDGATYERVQKEDGSFVLERTKPTRVWVATLSDYGGNIRRDDDDVDVPDMLFDTNEEMVNAAMERLLEFDTGKLNEECGDGYDGCFNHFDGSIDVGYRIDIEGMSWPKINISLVHAYYGK